MTLTARVDSIGERCVIVYSDERPACTIWVDRRPIEFSARAIWYFALEDRGAFEEGLIALMDTLDGMGMSSQEYCDALNTYFNLHRKEGF